MFSVGRKSIAETWVSFALMAVVVSTTAEARIFRRFFGFGGGGFRQPVFVQPQPVRRFPQSMGCGNGGFCGGQPSYRVVHNNNNNNFVNNNFDPNDFQQADARFKNIKDQKGVLFEANDGVVVAQLFVDERTGELFSVGVDRNGNVRGFKRPVATNSLTFAQLQRFYFDNLDKFKSALREANIEGNGAAIRKAEDNLNLVQNFLNFSTRATGIQRDGRVNFDISKMAMPESLKNAGGIFTLQNVAIAGLNSTLNMLTNQCDILCAGPRIDGNTAVGCRSVGNLNGNILSADLTQGFGERTIDLMTNSLEDPYSCGDRRTMRLDYFIAATLADPNKYYAIKQVPREYEELAERQGISENSIKFAQSREIKMVVGAGESIVAKTEGPSRVTGFQNQDRVRAKFGNRPAVAAMSLDFQNNSGAGVSLVSGLSQDLLHDPVGVIGSQAGGEKIDEQCNGFHMYSVQNGNGGRLNGVPGNVASHGNAIGAGTEVSNPLSCRECHSEGFRSGVNHAKEGIRHKTNPFEFLDAGEAARARNLGYRLPGEIGAVNNALNVDYRRAQQAANSRLPNFSVKEDKATGTNTVTLDPNDSIPAEFRIVEQYFKALGDEDVAREMGIPGLTVDQLENLRGPTGEKLFQLKFEKNPKTGKRKIQRDSFAEVFCKARAAISAGRTGGVVDTGNGRGRGTGNGRPGTEQFNHQTGQRI